MLSGRSSNLGALPARSERSTAACSCRSTLACIVSINPCTVSIAVSTSSRFPASILCSILKFFAEEILRMASYSSVKDSKRESTSPPVCAIELSSSSSSSNARLGISDGTTCSAPGAYSQKVTGEYSDAEACEGWTYRYCMIGRGVSVVWCLYRQPGRCLVRWQRFDFYVSKYTTSNSIAFRMAFAHA